ncbi:MAG: hypothetical protein RRZ84_01105 [Romboutsia sp.]
MNNKLKDLDEKLPKNCCSFCTHLSFTGPNEDYKYDIRCIMLDTIPAVDGSCDYFEPEYTKLSTTDLDNMYIDFLDTCLRVDFNDYLNSVYWQLFKKNTIHEYNNKCFICSSSSNLDVYHLRKNLGRETLDDVIVLCNECSKSYM